MSNPQPQPVTDGSETVQVEVALGDTDSRARWVLHPILSWRAAKLQTLARCDWGTAWAMAVTYPYSYAVRLIEKAARKSLGDQFGEED